MNIATALIEGNGRFEVTAFEDGTDKFVVFAKQTFGECRTGRVSIYIKANNNKAQRIGFFRDNATVDNLRGYVADEILA